MFFWSTCSQSLLHPWYSSSNVFCSAISSSSRSPCQRASRESGPGGGLGQGRLLPFTARRSGTFSTTSASFAGLSLHRFLSIRAGRSLVRGGLNSLKVAALHAAHASPYARVSSYCPIGVKCPVPFRQKLHCCMARGSFVGIANTGPVAESHLVQSARGLPFFRDPDQSSGWCSTSARIARSPRAHSVRMAMARGRRASAGTVGVS